MIQFLSLSLFPLLLTLAATFDVLTRRIPNFLILVALGCFFPLAFLAGMQPSQIGIHFSAALGVLFLGYAVFSFGWIGGGDAKLLAAAALWLGPAALVPFVVLTAVAGGLLSLAISSWVVVNMDAEIRGSKLFSALGWIRPKVPYGYAIAAGALLAFPQSWWVSPFPAWTWLTQI